MKSSLRADLARNLKQLGTIETRWRTGQIIVDTSGDAWQYDRGCWYRAFDSDHPKAAWEMSGLGPFTQLEETK